MARIKNRHFDDWTLTVHGVDEKVEVRAIIGKTTRFWARCLPVDGGKSLSVESTDIEKLKKMMRDRLAARIGLTWENKLHITIRSEISEIEPKVEQVVYDYDAKISVSIKPLQLCTLPDGSKIHRCGGESQAYCPGWPDVGKAKTDGWKQIDMQAFVDDTEENRAALQKLFSEFKKLNAGLCELLSPKNIQKTLASVKTSNFLPAPKEE